MSPDGLHILEAIRFLHITAKRKISFFLIIEQPALISLCMCLNVWDFLLLMDLTFFVGMRFFFFGGVEHIQPCSGHTLALCSGDL